MEIRSDRGISRAIVLVLIALFMVTSVLVVLCGAGAYGRATDIASANNERRVFMSYALNTVHMAAPGTVDVADIDGMKVLTVSDGEYVTYLYAYDGALMSLYTSAEYDFYPEDGETVTEMAAFEPSFESDKLIRFDMTASDGEVYTMHAAVN